MAAFPYQQHHSYLLDQTVFFPNPTTTTTTTAAAAAAACWFPQFNQPHDHPCHGYHHDQVSVANKLQSPDSSMSMVLDDQKVESGNEFLAKKRKDKQMSSLNQAQSKDTSNTLKKQKKINDYQEEKKKKNTKKGSCEEGAVEYIHAVTR
ncbi:hypothetical protein L1987_45046 [Smallanthus sonchifolius]|uniref:Uncharacterized protein n=1 Tax=Smallanthus sonchifolius TaxID=185202 RepID=A0ACB9GS50_9ASTR|nr:hypothetical protein L1987_45046 [Smallanthus sonchifolius]